jgi:hypothetical protein
VRGCAARGDDEAREQQPGGEDEEQDEHEASARTPGACGTGPRTSIFGRLQTQL